MSVERKRDALLVGDPMPPTKDRLVTGRSTLIHWCEEHGERAYMAEVNGQTDAHCWVRDMGPDPCQVVECLIIRRGVCGNDRHVGYDDVMVLCPDCLGSGKAYPAELVERIASIIFEIGPPNKKAIAILEALDI